MQIADRPMEGLILLAELLATGDDAIESEDWLIFCFILQTFLSAIDQRCPLTYYFAVTALFTISFRLCGTSSIPALTFKPYILLMKR